MNLVMHYFFNFQYVTLAFLLVRNGIELAYDECMNEDDE